MSAFTIGFTGGHTITVKGMNPTQASDLMRGLTAGPGTTIINTSDGGTTLVNRDQITYAKYEEYTK